MILVYFTCKDRAEAKAISKQLVESRLVACAVRLPAKSIYRWEGKLQDSSEVVVLCKTTEANREKVFEEIKSLHSYDVPCIISFKADSANDEYDKWVISETR